MAGSFALSSYQYGTQAPDGRLHDAAVQFFLSYDTFRIAIHEPVKWDQAEWVLARDKTWHGFTFEYTGDKASLSFREKKAVDFIEKAYVDGGPNASVYLDWQLAYNGDVLPMQRLRLVLSEREKKGRELTVPAEGFSLQPDIRDRWDTELPLDQVESLINDPVTGAPIHVDPAVSEQLVLHAQAIKQQTKVEQKEPKVDSDWLSFPNVEGNVFADSHYYRDFYLSFPLNNPEPNEVTGFTGSGIGVFLTGPDEESRYVLKSKAGGSYDTAVKLDFIVDARYQRRTISIAQARISEYSLDCYLQVGTERIPIGPHLERKNVLSEQMGAVRFQTSVTITRELGIDTPVYLYAKLVITPDRRMWKGTDVRLATSVCSFSITAKTTAPPTTTRSFTVLSALNHLTSLLTGKPGVVNSLYYGAKSAEQPADGNGYHRLLVGGYDLRGFANRVPKLSLQKLLTSLQAIDAIGMSYQPTPAGERLIVEHLSNWYRPNVIMSLTSFTVLDEKTATDRLYTKATIGYSKYPTDGGQVLDEFNTEQTYLFPMRAGGEYQQKSDLIASGYAIEQTRRAQFADTPQDSTSYDEDTFIICATPQSTGTTNPTQITGLSVQFGVYENKPALWVNKAAAPAWLAVGVTFTVTAGSVNNGTYRVLSVTDRTINMGRQGSRLVRTYTLSKPVSNEIAIVTIKLGTGQTVTGNVWVAERDEDFARVEGVVDSTTVYNLRISPRFNYLRHAAWLSGSLVYASASERIRVTGSKNNPNLRTQVKTNAPGDNNIDVRRFITHSDAVYVGDMRQPVLPIFSPETFTIETKLGLSQMLYLRACLQGSHPDATLHYGSIDLIGMTYTLTVFPQEIRYNPTTGRVELTVLKSFVSLSQSGQRGCSFYAAYTFEDFETSPPGTVDDFIEKCIFGGFQ